MSETLGRLATDLGERSLADAAAQCSRCGYCEQSCPTYKATGDEKMSPRGRNQLVRLLVEGKLHDKTSAGEALDTCLLCSACTSTCYAHVPTADIVLEGRRLLRGKAPLLARLLSKLLLDYRSLFEWLLRGANLAKRLGLARLGRPLLRALGLPGLALAEEHVNLAPLSFSNSLCQSGAKSSSYRQFLPCGTRYLFTSVAVATQKALNSEILESGCCGLLAYNYGELADAQEFAKRVIVAAEADERPVAVDCSSCASFLKSYPQLFLSDPDWQARAKAFSGRVKDVLELYDQARWPKGVATFHESCRACHGQGVKAKPTLKAGAEEFRALPNEDCCGGAGAFAFTQPELSDELLRRKIDAIAKTGATTVATSSTSCLIQLARGLSKYYPSCEVRHVSEIAAFSDGEKEPRA